MNFKEKIMLRCLELARKGKQKVTPNPMVGSVIVFDGKIIGEGYHKKYKGKHAEINAIESVQDKSLLKKSTLYVNLEPCNHFGNTPPCTQAIILNKIKKVVIGSLDPNKKARGGMSVLKENGVDVEFGVLNKKCEYLNRRFYTYQLKKRPYIILKWAQTLDGFIALNNPLQNNPLQISCRESKKLLHQWRAEEDAILIGKKTALLDNPLLTTRYYNGKNPVKVLLDNNLEVQRENNIFKTGKTLVFNKIQSNKGQIEHIKLDSSYNLDDVLSYLYKKNILSIIIEGGRNVLDSFISKKIWDEAKVFTSNKKLKYGLQAPTINKKQKCSKLIGIDTLKIYFNK